MWSAVINDQCNFPIFFSKLIFKLPYPFFQVLLIHSTFLRGSTMTKKFFDLFDAQKVVQFINDKHWEFVTVHICCNQTSQSYFFMLASSAFLIFGMESFFRQGVVKHQHYRFRFSNSYSKWFAVLFPSKGWSFLQ